MKNLFRLSGIIILAIVLSTGFFTFTPAAAAAKNIDWQPQKTRVFIAGTLKWKNSAMFSSFPDKNRRDAMLFDFFKERGVPSDQMIFLKDSQATTAGVRNAFKDFLSKSSEGEFLFVYYCGHGYKSEDARSTFFATYDAGENVSGWAVQSIVKDIESGFKGSKAFLAADCCYSGSLIEQAEKISGRVSFACLASSSASQTSTGNWTFTEALLAGFRGAPFADENLDGRVSLKELAGVIKGDMAFAEGQLSSFAVTGSFPVETVLANSKITSNKPDYRRVEAYSSGNWYKARIIEAKPAGFKVHYYGWEESDDEWVNPSQIRNLKIVQYAPGTNVEVEWKGKWYPAEILKEDSGVHLIHYRDYDASWDEWVSPPRIRKIKK